MEEQLAYRRKIAIIGVLVSVFFVCVTLTRTYVFRHGKPWQELKGRTIFELKHALVRLETQAEKGLPTKVAESGGFTLIFNPKANLWRYQDSSEVAIYATHYIDAGTNRYILGVTFGGDITNLPVNFSWPVVTRRPRP